METDRVFPDNWKEIIQGKKVIFYNSGLSSLLHLREKQIEKMKWVFQVFKEHPEAVLWWRPHPLELSTIQSMIPELEEQYRKVCKQYQEENVGILDESADLNRAIAISDAYYGAESSVTELYKAARKPILYEDSRIRQVEDTVFLPVSVLIKEKAIWFIQLNSNKLIKMDGTTYEVEKIVSISQEPSFQNRACNYHIVDIGTSLLLLFGNSSQIYDYNIEEDIVKVYKPQKEKFMFCSKIVLVQNDKLLLFPYDDTDILEYDYHFNTMERKRFTQKNVKIGKCYTEIESKVYMADEEDNSLYWYNLANGESDTIHIGQKDNKYWGVKKAGDYFVLPHIDKKAVTLWNVKTGETCELTGFPEGYVCVVGFAYFDMFEKARDVYILPFYANMILKIDVESKTIRQVFANMFFNADYSATSELYSGQTYIYAGKFQQYIYAYSAYKKCWHIFDLDTMEMQETASFVIKKQEHKKLIENILDNITYEKTFCEWERAEICTLENYIENLLCNYSENNMEKRCRKSIGTGIYKTLMNEL